MSSFFMSRLVAGALTLFACAFMAVSAAPLIPRDTFSAKTFTATGWTGDYSSSGIRIYIPQNGVIQEIANVEGQLPGASYRRGSTLSPTSDFSIPADTPLASSNINGHIRVFFYDAADTLRVFVWDGEGWGVGTLAYPVGGHAQKLAAMSWVDSQGTVNFSVFYTTSDGELFEATQSMNGEWATHRVGKAQGDGALYASAWTESGIVRKRIYYQDLSTDKIVLESTWNVLTEVTADSWSAGTTNNFPFTPSGVMPIAGAPAGSGTQERIFVNPTGTQNIVEYVRTGAAIAQSWSPGTFTLPAKTQSGTNLSAVGFIVQTPSAQPADLIAVYFLGTDGALSQATYLSNARPQWMPFSTSVAVF